jgi:hypothetical protein
MHQTIKENIAQLSTYINLRIAFIIEATNIIIGIFSYCYIFQLVGNEIPSSGGFLLYFLMFLKIYVLYFICAKTIDRDWDYKPTNEIINSQYRNSPYEDKVDRVTLHDIYHL